MTQTVYIVETGQYSDRYVVAVFSDKEKAKAYQRYIDLDNDIEEFQLDSEEEPDWFKNGYKAYYCWTDHLTEVRCRELNGSEFDRKDENVRKTTWSTRPESQQLCITCKAKSEEQAIRIAADKFAQYRYENSEELI
jgi:hypothetical protein